jgi:hypothetical protein
MEMISQIDNIDRYKTLPPTQTQISIFETQ